MSKLAHSHQPIMDHLDHQKAIDYGDEDIAFDAALKNSQLITQPIRDEIERRKLPFWKRLFS